MNLLNDLKKKAMIELVYSYSLLRTLGFNLQGRPLPLITGYFSNKKTAAQDASMQKNIKIAQAKIEALLRYDSECIANNDYPASVLKPEKLTSHLFRIPKIYIDAVFSALRRKDNQSKKFSPKAQELLKNLPEYYQRNFHFQTDGYLSEKSAELYEHQVEILFSGASNAMRRLIIPSMKKHFLNSKKKNLKFLEIGSGTGILTKYIALAFPNVEITSLDLSSEYLKLAENRLSTFKKIKYVQGAGEDLKFKNESFDAVFSCFLFHELPSQIRTKVVTESNRVLKKNGYFGLVDSLQKDDDPAFNWALEQFPVDFHEPFFKNYTLLPMEKILSTAQFSSINTEIKFLAKAISCTK